MDFQSFSLIVTWGIIVSAVAVELKKIGLKHAFSFFLMYAFLKKAPQNSKAKILGLR